MKLELRDFFSFAPSAGRSGGTSTDPEIREAARAGKGLKVTFAASHAGMVNGNNVMYSPRGMKDSSHTWVWPQRQPIQIHHDDHSDPIGRVIGARYAGYGETDVSDSQRDALKAFDNISKDKVVEAARALEDSEVLGQRDWRGIGELVLDGIVTDAGAVEKILDGRYQGVSITQRPQQAYCSICGRDWVKDDPCEHDRGEKDEESGRNMYLVVGDTDYVEISYVNTPADKHAMGIDIQPIENLSGAITSQDEKSDESSILDRSMQTTVFFQLVDSLNEETGMKNGKEKVESTESEKDQGIADGIADSEPTVENELVADPEPEVAPEPEQDSDEPEAVVQDSEDTPEKPVEDEKDEAPADPKTTVEEALKCLFEDRDNLTGFMCDALFEALEELVDEEDAKLSTKKRKSLASSTFCGPNRSFPVNDCAHYTAAKRLLGRYEGPGDKSSISTCIEQKGKALGCAMSKKDEQDEEIVSAEGFSLEALSDEMLTSTLADTERLMAERGLRAERHCDNCDALTAKCSEFETQIPEMQDTLRVLRSEYQTVLGEHVVSEDSHAETLNEFEAVLQDMALSILLLTDKETSEEDLKAKIKVGSFADLKKIVKETDISEVISFIRSGLSRDPEGTVTQDDAEPEVETIVEPVINLSKSLVKFYKDHGQNYATGVMNDWITSSKLPEDFTLDKAFELVAK